MEISTVLPVPAVLPGGGACRRGGLAVLSGSKEAVGDEAVVVEMLVEGGDMAYKYKAMLFRALMTGTADRAGCKGQKELAQ